MLKTVKTRVQNKHDIPANWEKATNFIPLAGELIIYDDHYFDDNNNKVVVADTIQYKIGDGVTTVNNLPFVDPTVALNLSHGSAKGSIQQVVDSNELASGFDFTDKNPKALELFNTLSDDDKRKQVVLENIGNISENLSVGEYSQSFGGSSAAFGKRAMASGQTTLAVGMYSHTEGDNSITLGDAAHAEGYKSTAFGNAAHSEGNDTVAEGNSSHAEGYGTRAKGENSHAEGALSQSTGDLSHAEGHESKAEGYAAHSEGYMTEATGGNAHSEGNTTHATATAAHAEGVGSTASNDGAHAEGHGTVASGYGAHAEGYQTEATNSFAHAEGHTTKATGLMAHAEGQGTNAIGDWSHAAGLETYAQKQCTFAAGKGTTANNDYQFVVGTYNDHSTDDALFTVGNGWKEGSSYHFSNAFEVYKDGRAKVSSAPQAVEDVVRLKELNEVVEDKIKITGTVTKAIGGIAKDKSYSNADIADVLSDLLFPYVAPTFSSITLTAAAGTFEYGTTKTVTKVTPNFTKGSKAITSIKVGTTSGGSDLYSGTTATSGTAITLTNSKTFDGTTGGTIYCTISDGTTPVTKSASIGYANYNYYAVTSSTTKPTSATATGVKNNAQSAEATITTADNTYIWFLMPNQSKTTIQQFAMNQWNNMKTTYEGSVSFTTSTGRTATYHAYRTDALGVATEKYRIN